MFIIYIYIIVNCSSCIYIIVVIVIYSLFSRAFSYFWNFVQSGAHCLLLSCAWRHLALGGILRLAAFQRCYLRINDRFTRIYTYIHGALRVLIGKARHFIPGTLPPLFQAAACHLPSLEFFLFFIFLMGALCLGLRCR